MKRLNHISQSVHIGRMNQQGLSSLRVLEIMKHITHKLLTEKWNERTVDTDRSKGGEQGEKLHFVIHTQEKEENINNPKNPKPDDFLLFKIVVRQQTEIKVL